jgi:hypothetical protein
MGLERKRGEGGNDYAVTNEVSSSELQQRHEQFEWMLVVCGGGRGEESVFIKGDLAIFLLFFVSIRRARAGWEVAIAKEMTERKSVGERRER